MSKILIVEDDPMIQEIYEKKFSEDGFEVITATTGKIVLEKVKNNLDIDVILLDLLMPKMNGFELTENLRNPELGYNQNIKIIIFSNLSQKEDRDKAMKLGANGFIAKSEYSPSDLVKEVKRLIGNYNEQEKNGEKLNGEAVEEKGKEKINKKKLLLIEDEKVFIEMFGEKLTQKGFEVVTAENGAWGVKEAMKEKFDLFIIDMVMPAMTGEEMIGKIKMEDETKDIPIIVLSASVEAEAQKKVEEMGIKAFYMKTQVTPTELAEKVEEILK